jgi:mycothiol synthase
MDLPAAIRPAERADLTALVQLVAATPVGELVDFEHGDLADLETFDVMMASAGAPVARLVALAEGQVVGGAQLFRVPWTSRAGHYWGTVRVAPERRRHGIGAALLDALLRSTRADGGRSLALELRDPSAALLEAVGRHGLSEVFRSVEYRGSPQRFDDRPFQDAAARAAARGVQIATLPDLQRRDADWLPKLHHLYATLSRDVPIPERAMISPEGLAEFIGGQPGSLPEACYIAVAADASYVGVSFMHRAVGEPTLIQKLTGVLAEHRGGGIATALKVATMVFARTHGYETISTWIETNNQPMLALAERLGFVRQPGGIVVVERAV